MYRYLLLLLLLLPWRNACAQGVTPAMPVKDTAAYTRDTSLPQFEILLTDSVTLFKSAEIKPGSPVALFYFSPGCGHCRRAVEELKKGMDSIREVRFYFLTNSHNMTDIKAFHKGHHLKRYKNIEVVGCDPDFFFLTHYRPRWTPEVALYDANLHFVALLTPDGTPISVKSIYDLLHKEQ